MIIDLHSFLPVVITSREIETNTHGNGVEDSGRLHHSGATRIKKRNKDGEQINNRDLV